MNNIEKIATFTLWLTIPAIYLFVRPPISMALVLIFTCFAIPRLTTHRRWLFVALLNVVVITANAAINSGILWKGESLSSRSAYATDEFISWMLVSLAAHICIFAPIYVVRMFGWGYTRACVIFVMILICVAVILPSFGRAREKPVIYLYPETTMEVNVQLNYDGVLTHTYPSYKEDGWTVIAQPNGTLTNTETGREHYCLFWEGEDNFEFSITRGSVVAGQDTVPFLENTLAKLGLNEREANEFIIYWQPRLEFNPYNLIHFATDTYNKRIPLIVDPKPDTMIRVFMVFQPLRRPVEIPEQQFDPVQRKGFTVVEWGGSERQSSILKT